MTPGAPRELQRFSPAERREAILDAARAVFSEMGLAGARTKAIAERAGVAEGLVFKYFKSKEYLFEVAVVEVLEGLLKRVESVATEFAEAEERKAEPAIAFHLEIYEAMVEIAPLLGSVLFEKHEIGESFYARILGPAITRIAEALGVAVTKWPRHVDARMLTLVFLGTHFFTAVDAKYRHVDVDADKFARSITSLFSEGFGPH